MTRLDNDLAKAGGPQAALSAICEGFFDERQARRDSRLVDRNSLPPPYSELLDHRRHMTATLGQHFGEPVKLRVLKEQLRNSDYSRKILLTAGPSGAVVEFGIARLDLGLLDPEVREAVCSRRTPLGSILMKHNMLCAVDPLWYYAFGEGSPFVRHFNAGGNGQAFGRIAVIHCDSQPAIQLLEVVTGSEEGVRG